MKTVPPDAVNGRSVFLISPTGTDAWRVTVHRPGMVEETIHATSRAEACRLSRRLTDAGLIGFIEEHTPWTTPRPSP